MLLFSALLSVLMGAFVFVVGQELRVKGWFLLLCISTATLSMGLWAEANLPEWSFFAARVNMTSALAIAIVGLVSVRTIYGLPVRAPIVALILIASAVILVTVWLTNEYFTGALIHYSWGAWVAARPAFLVSPILTIAIAAVGLFNLWTQYRSASPLDRNRAKYILLANLVFSTSALDYLPHFGISLFGGLASTFSIPLFLMIYAYAMLRYRLFEFQALMGRVSGWILVAVLLVATYALSLAIGERLGIRNEFIHVAAALIDFTLWITIAHSLPLWTQRLFSGEPDFLAATSAAADDIIILQDEVSLHNKWSELCGSIFEAQSGRFMETDSIPFNLIGMEMLERELFQRMGRSWPESANDVEIMLPIWRRDKCLGVMGIGKRRRARMYPQEALEGLRHVANIFSIAIFNVRASAEIELRHRLDRYLAPQVIDGILGGNFDAIEKRRRIIITVFFSDIEHFSDLADHIDPDSLSIIMNDYLADMADIAFEHGGTVDKFIGDAVMVLFGAPIDEDPTVQVRQCVAMACKMHNRIEKLNAHWRTAGILADGLRSRMGIHTGEATVGSFGSRARVEYTALGRSVNLASRLEESCTPGRILVSEQTWRHCATDVRSECRGSISVKGFTDPVEVYEIFPD